MQLVQQVQAAAPDTLNHSIDCTDPGSISFNHLTEQPSDRPLTVIKVTSTHKLQPTNTHFSSIQFPNNLLSLMAFGLFN